MRFVGVGLALISLLGCSQVFGLDKPQRGDGGARDGNGSDVIDFDGEGPCTSFSIHLDTCALPAGQPDQTLDQSGNYAIGTTAGSVAFAFEMVEMPITTTLITQPGNVPALVWRVGDFTLGPNSALYVVGDTPLIIVAEHVTIQGNVEASSLTGLIRGAGSNPAECSARAATAGGNGDSGAGGGGGGGFQGKGGTGGKGDANCATAPPACETTGGVGGNARSGVPTIVIGGCDGGASGTSMGVAPVGGAGGGAVLIVARTTIEVTGAVLARGGGGTTDTSTTASLGGGGGGAGGFIGLEAPSIDVSDSVLAANGGGGGGGGDIATTASPGADGTAGSSAAAGGAGTSNGNGTAGGTGGFVSQLDGSSVTAATPIGSGGGGGGGAGFVALWGTVTSVGATISPAAAINP